MDRQDAAKVLEKVVTLFDWQISEDQASAWMEYLAKTNISLAAGLSAAQAMFEEESRWPRIATFRKVLATTRQICRSEEPEKDPTPIGWIICQTNDVKQSRVGWCVPVIVPGVQPPEDRHLPICERHAQRYGKAFGGRWVFCVGWTAAQAHERARQYRAEAGIVVPAPSAGMLSLLKRLESKLVEAQQ